MSVPEDYVGVVLPASPPDPRVLAITIRQLPADAVVACPSPAVATAIRAEGWVVLDVPLDELADAAADAVVLLDDELGQAGEHAEELVAEASRVITSGGLLVVSVRSRIRALAAQLDADTSVGEDNPVPPTTSVRGHTADEVRGQLGHRGFAVELLCAPGAASLVATGVEGPYIPELDGQPGLLDAGAQIVAVGRRYPDEAGRSAAFFASLPRTIVAAGVVCRHTDGRLLIVHDTFKQHWTIPGGVVDSGEDPATGAAREAREEAGVDVTVGGLLGLFSSSPPNRLLVVYGARPQDESCDPAPIHAHEIGAVEWVTVATALERVAPHVRFQLECCLGHPGGTWRQ